MIIAAVLFLHIKNRVCKSGYQLIIPVAVKYGGIGGQGHYSDSVTAELYFIRLALYKIGVVAVGIRKSIVLSIFGTSFSSFVVSYCIIRLQIVPE